MGIKSIIERLRYPHKWSALRYFVDDPRLFFGISPKPSKLHLGFAIERMLGGTVVDGLNLMLPEKVRAHLQKERDYLDKQGFRLLLFLLVRRYRPSIVIETGVARGMSSAYILAAMQENGHGHLFSIDLPPAEVPYTFDESQKHYVLKDGQRHRQFEVGHLVPEFLRDRWTLLLEDARVALPRVIQDNPQIDIFYHDSLHTRDHMMFEYETAWPAIREGGLLVSDDILWNDAFHSFARRHRRRMVIYRSFGYVEK